MLDDLELAATLNWLATGFRIRFSLVVLVENTAHQGDFSVNASVASFSDRSGGVDERGTPCQGPRSRRGDPLL